MSEDYQIIEKLGQGGMGVVYKALDKRLNRTVALKVMAEHLAEHPTLVARFEREARAAAVLSHPHVVTVHAIARWKNLPMIVMEYVPGKSLAELMRSGGAVEPRRALKWTEQVASALAVAHDASIIHRDIKPHNILLNEDSDNVKVADFGIAHVVEDQGEMTATGVQPGTPRYMSPEQCEGKRVTHQTDLFSLGAVLYELLSGKPAFPGSNPVLIVRKIVDKPTPNILDECPSLPYGVAQMLAKMMAKEPEARYATAQAVVEDIRSLLATGVAPGAMDVELGEGVVPALPGLPEAARPLPGSAQDFVVHYVESDSAWAEWIQLQLTEAGYKGELEVWNFKTSHESLRKLLRGATGGLCVIAIVSPAYLTAIHGHREWAHAFMHGELGPVPVRVRACNLTGTFRTLHYIDLAELDQKSGRAALLNELRERCGPREPVRRVVDFKRLFDGLGNVELRHTVWNIAHSAGDDFVGRSEELAKLHHALETKRGAVLLEQAPNDIGCGATELALEYARLNRSNYDVVWLVRSDRRLVSMLDFIRLARELGLAEKDAASIPVTIRGVRNWLDRNGKWLLIFDDVKTKEGIAGYLPARPKGNIILTTSSREWSEKYDPLVVGPFERETSIEFLFRRTGERNEGASAALAAAAGDLSLPMMLGASYVRGQGASLDQYIDLFLTRHRDLWGFQTPPRDVRSVTSTALSLVIDVLASQCPAALDLLKVCAYWGPYAIRLSRLASNAKLFPRSLAKMLQQGRALKDGVSLLVQLGLAWEKDDVVVFHPLIQDLVRTWLETDVESGVNDGWYAVLCRLNANWTAYKHRMVWPTAALEFVHESFPRDFMKKETWEECDRLLPQSVSAVEHARRLGLDKPKVTEAWRILGQYLAERSVFGPAAEVLESAITVYKEHHGAKHKGLAELYKELARVRWKQNHLDGAREAFEEALAIEERSHKGAHADIAACLSNLGNVCAQLGDHARARHYYQKALEIDMEVYGRYHVDVGRDFTNLGLVSQELGDLNAAWEYYRDALHVLEQTSGAEHQMTMAVKNLAGLLYTMGDLAEAKKYYKMAIEQDTTIHGEHHPSVAQSYHNLAMTLEGLGFHQDALSHYLKALAINEAVYGRNHPKVGMNKNNLGNLAARGGDLEAAEAYYKDAYAIFRQHYGEQHKLTVTASRNLHRVRRKLNQDKSGPKVT